MTQTDTPNQQKHNLRHAAILATVFITGALVMAAVGALLLNIQERKDEAAEYPRKVMDISPTELDPAVWGMNFPREYDSFMRSKDDTISTPYGGSIPFNKLERVPAMTRIWAGYAFSV